MENYAEFSQLCLSKLKENEEGDKHLSPFSASSMIRFYGRPILPPLLSGSQREEMRRHRSEAQKATANKKLKEDPRMAYVQTILHSVQLRKTPTLQELLQETEIKARSSHPHNTNGFSVSCSDVSNGPLDSLSPVPVGKLKNGIFIPPKTSTACSAFAPSNTSSSAEQYDSQQVSQPCSFNAASRQSLSSGYVTFENQEHSTVASGKNYCRTSEEMNNIDGFFLHSTSNTIAKMPDIISHPPIDGEELERTGVESFFCSNTLGEEDVCSTSFHIDPVSCGPPRAEQPELSHSHSLNKGVNIPFTAKLDLARNSSIERNDGSIPLTEKNGLSHDPDLQQALNLTAEIHVHKNPSKAEAETVDSKIDAADLKKPEESRPLSLQTLLKKSQEYRRRQRMLRNQAKNTKLHQETTQEQPRARVEEPCLSDKENDEFHRKDAVTVEGKKTKERRGTLILSEGPSPQKSWELDIIQSDVTEGKHVAEHGKTKGQLRVEQETTIKNKLNISQEVITEPKQIGVLIQQQQPVSVNNSLIQGTPYETPCLPSFHGGVGKYRSVPVPSFCLSPVPCKSKAVEAAGTLEPKFDSSSDFDEIRVRDLSPHHQRSQTAVPSAVSLMVEDNATNVFAKSSLHIDQLESNLCTLKVLISDLESTVKENMEDHRRPDSSMQSGESSMDSGQIENAGQDNSSGCLENTQGAVDDGNEIDDLKQRQPFIQFNKKENDVGHELADNAVWDRGSEIIKLSKQSQTTATKRENPNEMSTDEDGSRYTQRGICKKEQQPPKSIMSVAQQMRIPSIFRNITSKTLPPWHVSHCGTHVKEIEGNITVVASPSLNQSYDVDTPSDLWFQEGSVSNPGSQGSHGQKKNLTPESGSEDLGGLSKVKRRLLMQVTEGTPEKNEGSGRAMDSAVRPNSSTPKGYQKQEQLKRIHAAQVRALQEEHRRQQEELLKVLAARYRLLQDASPCSTSASRFGDTLTFSSLSQPLSPLSQHCRPLLAAAVKGFLTRRLLRTERVEQLVRTMRDTQQFLQAFQEQSTSRGELCCRQDILLQERVALQLRAARYELYDIFFSLSVREQMQLIRWDRDLARERQLRQQNRHAGYLRGKSSLSAATQKSLERKRERMIQKKAAEGTMMRTGQKSRFSAEKPLETKQGHFKANPLRVPKGVCSSRPR